jgi:hypothetical protein
VSVLPLTEVRARAAAALAPATEGDFPVLLDVADAVDPPVILLIWDDPWLTVDGFGPCIFSARFSVLCIAARLEPGPGVETLERMVTYAIERLRADAYSWPQATSSSPRELTFANVKYLGAFLTYQVRVTTEGGP